MKLQSIAFAVAAALLIIASPVRAQAPAGSTGECKDGTYTSSESKRGACRGHGGVKDWYATDNKAAKSESKSKRESAPAMPATTPEKSTVAEPKAPSKAQQNMRSEAAAGGGAGKVWVNSSSNVYHCMGDEWYGKTKRGEYMSEADAKAHGARPARGKTCT